MGLSLLPLGTLRPSGWLARQLQIQCDGPTIWLAENWPDIAQSQWIGGDAEGWERGPYWLDGAVPLAILTGDEKLLGIVRRWIDTILARQHADGWMGQTIANESHGARTLDPWPLFLIGKAFLQWEEATGDPRIVPALLRMLRRIDLLLDGQPLSSWAKMRWMELALVCCRLRAKTGEDWLLDLAKKAEAQGYDWRRHFAHFRHTEKSREWTLEAHVVNHAMALKVPAVRVLMGADADTERARLRCWFRALDHFHGQVTGAFSGDECLAGRSPSQGTETCAVVECLYSLAITMEAMGSFGMPQEPVADRWERIAFNALPAAFTPDMHGHQYDQQVNQIAVGVFDENVYTTNGPRSNVFGLEPNFGCCTANLHQGWPKFAAHLWMKDESGAYVALSYAPCVIDNDEVHIEVETDYPFKGAVAIHVAPKAGPVTLHYLVPDWVRMWSERISVDGEPLRWDHRPLLVEQARTIHIHLPLEISATRGNVQQERDLYGIYFCRGPLLFSLPIPGVRRAIAGVAPAQDWEIAPTGPWNWMIDDIYGVEPRAVGETPFDWDNPPVVVHATVRRVPEWGAEKNAAAPPPFFVEPDEDAQVEERVLVPYACAPLRITVFPAE